MFREVLRNYKKERGLTSSQLAAELDVHYTTISLWMAGKREPTLRYIRKIRKLTNVPYEQLLSEPSDLEAVSLGGAEEDSQLSDDSGES